MLGAELEIDECGRLLFDAAGSVAFFVDLSAECIELSLGARQRLGLSLEAPCREPICARVSAAAWPAIRRQLTDLGAGQQCVATWRLRAHDDSLRELVVRSLKLESGNVLGVCQAEGRASAEPSRGELLARLQTPARLEEQLIRTERMECVGQLAGGVAHDFNNLLTSVISFIELSQHETPRLSPAHGYLDQAMQAAERGATLSHQLLAFARKKVVAPQPVSLSAFILDMTATIGRVLGERVSLELSLAEDLGAVKIDVACFEQVIMNLVVNARDAMPSGGRLQIETRSAHFHELELEGELPSGDYVMLTVCDDGEGMTEEVKTRIFEPFFTTKPVGVGSGLGLSMCHGIVRQAGGAVYVASAPGEGASFCIVLPRLAGARVEGRPVRIDGSATGGQETLLLVEDEPTILQLARIELERLGYRVLAAGNGPSALELLRQAKHVDLLVTDVIMPYMGGRELADRVCQLLPDVAVLYTSGYAEQALGEHGVIEEWVNFLQKPYTLSTLATRIRAVLDERRGRVARGGALQGVVKVP